MIHTKHRSISDSFIYDLASYHQEKHQYEPSNICEMPVKWHKATDFSVFDDKGNKWIDATSGIFVANAGHSNPDIKKAIKNQLDEDLLFAYQEKIYRKITDDITTSFPEGGFVKFGKRSNRCGL